MVKSFCIDDKNMPADYPDKSKWVKEGNSYKVIRVQFLIKSNALAFQLNEIDMENESPYFGWFRSTRFAIPIEELEKLKELIKASKEEMGVDFDINKFIEEIDTVNI